MGRLTRVRDRLRGRSDTTSEVDPSEPVPCIPCGQSKGVRQFAITEPLEIPVADADVPSPAPSVIDTVIDNQVVVLDTNSSMTNVLNASAALIWLTVDGERTVVEIVDDLAREIGAPREVIDPDVRDAIRRFVGSGMLRLDPPTAGAASSDTEVEAASSGTRASARRVPSRWHAVALSHLDGVDWTTTIGPSRAAGLDLVVRTNIGTAQDELNEAIGVLPKSNGTPSAELTTISLLDSGAGPRRYRVYLDGSRRWTGATDEAMVPFALSLLNQEVIDRTAGHVLLHAGAVERDGQVVVIAGDSGRGKSTLTAALVQSGFRYLTDEAVAIEPDSLAVLAYPKSIDLEGAALDLLGVDPTPPLSPGDSRAKHRLSPTRFGAVSEGGTLALVVLLVGDDTAEQADDLADPEHLETSPQVARLVELLTTTFLNEALDPRTLDTLSRIVEEIPILRATRASLSEQIERIAELLPTESSR